MTSISRNFLNKWVNYHRTIEGQFRWPGQTEIDGTEREIGHLHCADLISASGPERFASTGALLRQFIEEKLRDKELPGGMKLPAPERCELIGKGWSFSKLVGAKDLQLDLTGLAGMSECLSDQLSSRCKFKPENLVFVSGGTRLREIAEWARSENRGKSIYTSGTHLGPTIAGGFGTASHGSRIGFGGLQNLIHGIHLIKGPDPEDSGWTERESISLLNDETIAKI